VSAPASSSAADRREREGVLLCVSSATCFAATMVVAKLGHRAGATVVTLLAVRFTVGAALLWLVAARRGVARVAEPRRARVAFALGFLLATQAGLTFSAVMRIHVSLAELLMFTYPALVVLGAIALRHEPFSRRRMVALALSLSGVALVLAGAGAGSGALDPLGIALALGGATLFACYVLTAARVGAHLPAPTFAALVCSGAAVAFVTAGSAAGTLHLAMSAQAWACALTLALCSTLLAIGAFLAGVARLGPGRASILATLEPPLACLLAFVVLGERLTAPQLLGGALVVSAALVLQLRSIRSHGRGAPALPSPRAAARALARRAAGRRRVGVRAEVGRVPGARVRRWGRRRAPVARR
jgi:drug/metabolite transporter (DMT)-like permease